MQQTNLFWDTLFISPHSFDQGAAENQGGKLKYRPDPLLKGALLEDPPQAVAQCCSPPLCPFCGPM